MEPDLYSFIRAQPSWNPQFWNSVFLICTILLVVILSIMITIIVLLIKWRDMHPLKQQSPKLMAVSALGNMLLCTFLLLQGIFYSWCLKDSQSETDGKCKNYGFC